MSKLIFKPDMFFRYASTIKPIIMETETYEEFSARMAQQIFDEWLEKQTVVFGFGASDGWGWRTDSRNGETKKAYVVCIEDIKCEHKNVAIVGLSKHVIECLDCNKQLKPKNGWEIVNE